MDPRDEVASIIGLEVEARFRDGTSERVKVREVGYELMERYAAELQNETVCIELFCEKEPGWAARLTGGSHAEIMEKGQGLNLPLLKGFLNRRTERTETVNPGMTQKLEEMALTIARESMEKAMSSAQPKPSESSPAATT